MTDQLHLDEFRIALQTLDRSQITIDGYLGDVRLFAKWYAEQYGEALEPQTFTNETVRSYRQHLLDQQAKPKTINRRLASLAAFAHWLEQAGYGDGQRNPVQGIKAIREVGLAPKWLDRKERAALLRAVDREVEDAVRRYPRMRLLHLRDAAIVRLMLYTGLRVGEVVGLKLNDIVMDDRKGTVVVREGKGTKRREVPLNAKVRKALQDYLRVRPEVESDYLFVGQRNEGVKAKTVQRSVSRFSKVAGLKDVTPHTLRHSFAKALMDNGVSLEMVATLLGHANLNTTRIYTTPGEKDLEEAVGKLVE